MRRFLPIGSLVLASCVGINAAPYDAPTYSYQGIDLSGTLSGRLVIRDGCLVLIDPQDSVFQLIWPDRSSFKPDEVSFDNGTITRTIPFGTTVKLFGGFNEISPANAAAYGTKRCLG